MSHLRLGVVGVVGLALIGCNPDGGTTGVTQRPIDQTEATTTTNARVDEILTGLADATNEVDTTDSTSIVSDGLNAAVGSNPCGTSSSSGVVSTASSATDSVPASTTNALGEAIAKIRDEAKEHVFRSDLVESDDGNKVVYKIAPTEVCDSNTECIDKLTRNPVRFAVTANSDDTLNVALLVGQDQHSPATAVLGTNKLSVRGNLAEAMDTLRLFLSTEEQKDLPEKFAGVLEWSIEKRSEGEFAISSSVIERFELLTGQAKGKPISVTVQPTTPTSQITINSITNTVGFKENVGTVDVSVAGAAICGDMTCGTAEQSGVFGLHLAGLSGEFAATAGAEELTFSGLGLGAETSHLAVNGKPLTSVDVNPNSGRKFSINFKKTAEGTLVTFEPELDLSIAMAMTNLSESMRTDMPDWLMNEVFDVTLGGAPKSSILIPAAGCDANGNASTKDQLKVVTGTLTLDSTSLTNPVEVVAGMCLVAVDSSADQPNPMTLVASGACE